MSKLKRKCAQCGDKSQMNVIHRFRRYADEVIFYICTNCRENDLVKGKELKLSRTKKYTNYE